MKTKNNNSNIVAVLLASVLTVLIGPAARAAEDQTVRLAEWQEPAGHEPVERMKSSRNERVFFDEMLPEKRGQVRMARS